MVQLGPQRYQSRSDRPLLRLPVIQFENEPLVVAFMPHPIAIFYVRFWKEYFDESTRIINT
jgi:hypothetical protein